MNELEKLISEEGRKNNELKRILQNESYLPEDDIIKQLDVEELFKLSRDSMDFRFRVNLKILVSNYHLSSLVDFYLRGSNTKAKEEMQRLTTSYRMESEEIENTLVTHYINGREGRW